MIEEEYILGDKPVMWRRRWFAEPGLTGLAQINDVNSLESAGKLRYDLQHVRDQSFQYDIHIVAR